MLKVEDYRSPGIKRDKFEIGAPTLHNFELMLSSFPKKGKHIVSRQNSGKVSTFAESIWNYFYERISRHAIVHITGYN